MVGASTTGGRMICTVSTVKDSAENLHRFVARNLAAGADHLFVFLDGEGLPGEDFLRAHHHVTAVVTDDAYWAGERPDSLNLRQEVNANLVNFLLAWTRSAQWLAHLDSDECLHVDRRRLDALSPEAQVVSLKVWEAVSQLEEPEVQYFKRTLRPRELAVLYSLGMLERPSNSLYFRGHRYGKVLLRPSFDAVMKIHSVLDTTGTELPMSTGPGLRLLHYDSATLVEFVRKWDAHRGVARRPGSRRAGVAGAVPELLDNQTLDDERRWDYLREIYRRNVADDVERLRELGYLVQADPALHRHEPVGLDPTEQELVHKLLDVLVREDKEYFVPRIREKSAARLKRRLTLSHPVLARRLSSA